MKKRASELTDEIIRDHNPQHRSGAVIEFKNNPGAVKKGEPHEVICGKTFTGRGNHSFGSDKGFDCKRRIVSDPSGDNEIIEKDSALENAKKIVETTTQQKEEIKNEPEAGKDLL